MTQTSGNFHFRQRNCLAIGNNFIHGVKRNGLVVTALTELKQIIQKLSNETDTALSLQANGQS